MSSLTLSAILQIVDEASKPLKMIQQLSDNSADSIDDLRQSIDRLNRTLGGSDAQKYNKSLKQTEKNSQAARTATKFLITEYGQVDHALTSLLHKADQWNARLAQSRQTMRQDFKNFAVGSVIAGAGLYKFFQPAIEFEKQMSGVQAVLDLEKQSVAMKMLQADARRWGATSSFSPTEAAMAQFNLGSGGFNPQQIHDALGGVLQLAEAGKVELAQAAQIAVGTLNGFGLAAKEIDRVNDVFLKGTNLTAISVEGLGETMKYVAPIAKAYGSSIEQATAMTGLLGNNNILDTQAGTSLRSIMTRFAGPPKEANKAFAKLKIQTKDNNGNLRDMSDILAEINVATKNMGSGERLDILKDIAGQEAVSAFAVLVDQTAVIDETTGKTVNKIKQLTSELENSKGAAARAAAILKDNLAGDIENMGGAWQDLSISLNEILKADFRKFVRQITDIIDRVKKWVDANPELVRTIAQIAMKLIMFKLAFMTMKYGSNLFLGAIISVIAGITKLTLLMWVLQKIAGKLGIGLPSRFSLMSKAVQFLGRTFMFLGRQALPLLIAGIRTLSIALLTNPITWIIAAIALVALLIYKYWGPIKAFFQGFWVGLQTGLAPFKDTVIQLFNQLKTTLAPLKPVWDALVDVWNIFKNVIAEIFTPFQATNQQLANATSYGQSLGQIIGVVIGILGEFLAVLVKVAMFILVQVGTAIGEFVGWMVILPERVSAAFTTIKNIVMDAGATFINFLLTPIRQVIDAVNVLIGGLNKIPSVKIPSIPQIPQVGATAPVATPTSIQTKAIVPLKASQAKSVTNHFAAPQISISGVQDPNAVGSIVDQKLKNWQLNASTGSNTRSYNDID